MVTVSRPRGRPADPAVDRALREAVLTELTEHGWRGSSLERVATRAGVARTTIYRRYGSANGLLLLLMGEIYAQVPVPDTGTLRGDLAELMRAVVAVWRDPAHVRYLGALVAAQDADESVAAAYHAQFEHRRAATSTIVARAIERGEVSADTDADLLLDLLAGFAAQRVLLRRKPLTERIALASVDMLLSGVYGYE